MGQLQYSTKPKKYKHILRDDRYVIEKMLNTKQSEDAITAVIGCSEKTLRREIKRGTRRRLNGKTYEYESVYSWDAAQRKHDDNGKNKGRYAKINDEPELRAFIENKIESL